MIQKLFVIINPAAGQNEPILNTINQMLFPLKISWDVGITLPDRSAADMAREALKKDYDAIAVYGGDGTVMETAQVLYKTGKPLIIFPGGTANVLAKELGIPVALAESVKACAPDALPHKIDMFTVNDIPYLIRFNLGFFADMVVQAQRELKDMLGQLAYGVGMMKSLPESVVASYTGTVDGKPYTSTGAGMVIANCGNIGITGMSYHAEMSITDGKLDILTLPEGTWGSIGSLAGNLLLDTETAKLNMIQFEELELTISPQQTLIADDHVFSVEEGTALQIKVQPQALTVILPTVAPTPGTQ